MRQQLKLHIHSNLELSAFLNSSWLALRLGRILLARVWGLSPGNAGLPSLDIFLSPFTALCYTPFSLVRNGSPCQWPVRLSLGL